MHEKVLVLDTCALLWLAQGSDRLSGAALASIDRASLVLVSAISAWEISLKVARKGLTLPMEPRDWFERVISHHGLMVAPLDVEILIAANALPWHHRDPADRFVIATAVRHKATIVTADRRFSRYDVALLG